MLELLTEWTPEAISGLVSGIVAGIVAVVAAVGKVINDKRRQNGCYKCCITGRKLKPKAKKGNKVEGQ